MSRKLGPIEAVYAELDRELGSLSRIFRKVGDVINDSPGDLDELARFSGELGVHFMNVERLCDLCVKLARVADLENSA